MYCLELINSDVSNTSYCIEVESDAVLCDVARSWKMILGDHGKVVEIFLRKMCGNPLKLVELVRSSCINCSSFVVAVDLLNVSPVLK